jgi:FkbM family methyltransferase
MSRSRLLESEDFNQLAAGRDGYFLYNRNDYYIGRSIEQYGEYNALEMKLFRQFCTAGHVVIEVGANIGAHTVGLARLVGPQGRVLAFEPQRLPFQTLCANVALNSIENVDCIWAAVGSQDGFIEVPDLDPRKEFNFGAVTLLGAHNGRQVACHTLDQYSTLSRVDLIKGRRRGHGSGRASGRRTVPGGRRLLVSSGASRDRRQVERLRLGQKLADPSSLRRIFPLPRDGE